MRIATYNVEWFDHLFDDRGRLLDDNGWSGRYDVRRWQQIDALGTVFSALDADAVLVVEAPDLSRSRRGREALEGFARWAGLRARKALYGFASDTQQEIALLYDPEMMSARHVPGTAGAPGFETSWKVDLDVDGVPENVVWSKPPLEAELRLRTGRRLRLIGVHAKSKAPHGARDADHALRIAVENRRKQLAQCIWLRARVSALLEEPVPLIVLGDFNDGPGIDHLEHRFGRSGVEVVLGAPGEVPLHDPHALSLPGEMASARFYQPGGAVVEAMLDYIMVSPELRAEAGPWRIWSPFLHPAIAAEEALSAALSLASDHFPVTLDLDIG